MKRSKKFLTILTVFVMLVTTVSTTNVHTFADADMSQQAGIGILKILDEDPSPNGAGEGSKERPFQYKLDIANRIDRIARDKIITTGDPVMTIKTGSFDNGKVVSGDLMLTGDTATFYIILEKQDPSSKKYYQLKIDRLSEFTSFSSEKIFDQNRLAPLTGGKYMIANMTVKGKENAQDQEKRINEVKWELLAVDKESEKFEQFGPSIKVRAGKEIGAGTYRFTVQATKAGFLPKKHTFEVAVLQPVRFLSVTANGQPDQETTTELILGFDQDPGELDMDKIVIAGPGTGDPNERPRKADVISLESIEGSPEKRRLGIAYVTADKGEPVSVMITGNPQGKFIKEATQNVELYRKAFEEIGLTLPNASKIKVADLPKTEGSHGFKVDGNKVTHVAIRDGKAMLTLSSPVYENASVMIKYEPTDAPNEQIRFEGLPEEAFEVEFVGRIDRTIPTDAHVPSKPIANGGEKDIMVLDTGHLLQEKDHVQGIRLLQYDGKAYTLNIDKIRVSVAADGSIRIKMIDAIVPIGAKLKAIYSPTGNSEEGLMKRGEKVGPSNILPIYGVITQDGEVREALRPPQPPPVPPAPPSSPPSGGGSGGGGSSSSDTKNRPDPKQETQKEEQKTATEKISAKLTIGSTNYTVVIDGKAMQKTMDIAPKIHQGRTVLPARMIAELLGVEVKYTPATKTANFVFGKETMQLTLGQKTMFLNGKEMPLTADILNVNGRILLPLTDIQKAFAGLGLEAKVDWDAGTKSVTVER
ncbi:MAG: copper amine oxidase N-terminal domain-containing protein [Peptostreptococcaceae bacterium]|nr:copper amine oxidase N-terminal domain-containing protein [Peptostreptococcaceae bacterium]